MKKINILLGALAAFSLVSCFDLDKMPEGVISSAAPFKSSSEMSSYVNQFYESAVRTMSWSAGVDGGTIAEYDTYSDNMAGRGVRARTNGMLSVGGASSLSNYTQIRNVNFLLNNLDNCPSEKGNTAYNQAVGEAYYFRAWYYYQMFINYGPLAWVETPLDPSLEATQLPRENRTFIADKILADLDTAAELLGKKANNSGMRIHRDVALALKSEVALFEATWERYHKAKNDAFYDKTVTDDKIKDYLQQAIDAAEAITGWSIYTGAGNDSYRKMFQTTDLSSNPEVLWFKRYDASQGIGNHLNRYLNWGGGEGGATASLVDDYLTADGRPFIGEDRLNAKKHYGDEFTNRDGRLTQTICTPGQVLRPDYPQGYGWPAGYPPIASSNPKATGAFHTTSTGYSLLKYVQIDYAGDLDAEGSGSTPAIQFRYADVLLNLAEAYAELDDMNGTRAHDANIIAAVQPLRDRVGMPAMDFDREYNTESDYPFKDLPKTIQAVRRERRVEKACEGRRFEDILRWAAADKLLTGYTPKGVLYIGSDLETAYLNDDGSPKLIEGTNLYLTGSQGDTYRYLLPINPTTIPNGFGFRESCDYLLPISLRMIQLTNGLWEQNPGW